MTKSVNPDVAVRQVESIAALLKALSTGERREFPGSVESRRIGSVVVEKVEDIREMMKLLYALAARYGTRRADV